MSTNSVNQPGRESKKNPSLETIKLRKKPKMEAIFEGEWNSGNGICFDEAEFMSQLIGNCPLPDEAQHGAHFPAPFWVAAGFNGSTMNESYHCPNAHHVFVDLPTMDSHCTDDFLNQDVSNDSLDSNTNISEDVLLENNVDLGIALPSPNSEPRKRPRGSGGVGGNRRSVRAKKGTMMDGGEEDNRNAAVVHRQNSSSYCSEDDSNTHGVTSTSCSKGTGKTRANRGSATDPQSLYARKRRERINERLRILQTLVPNGTKVDISTMLEEAVQYVKFLQLQIKLLSSDEMWMYSPIAYNGMNINLN